MAGRPRTRAKREAEARGKRRFDRVAKEAALQRAVEVGSKQAAAELGVSMSTLRSWRKRLADEPSVPAVVEQGQEDSGEGLSRADRLRARASRAREAQHRAEDAGDRQIAGNQSAEARNSAVVAGSCADRARELEAAADAAELHEAALSEREGELVLEALSAVFTAIDVALPVEVAELALLGQAVPDEVAASARERVRARLRSTVEAEIHASRFVSRHPPQAGESEAESEGEPVVVESVAREPREVGPLTVRRVTPNPRAGRRLTMEQRARGGA